MHLRTFLNGLIVGAIIGILFAPDSGEETRKKLSRKASGIKDSYNDFKDNVADTVDKVKSKASGLADKAKGDYYDVKSDVESNYTN